MRIILDLESCSELDLTKTGVHTYAAHPSTRVTVACFAVDQNPVETWLPGDPPPASFAAAVAAGAITVAHNYTFDRVMYEMRLEPLGWPPVPLEQWSCSMARSLVAGFPASLEAAGKALGLDIQKDTTAHRLMLKFARPRSLEPLTWWDKTDPEQYRQLVDYCIRDVEAERALDDVLPELSPRERRLFELDAAINQRGLYVDLSLVARMAALATKAQSELNGQIYELTRGQVQTLNQRVKLLIWLAGAGVDMENLQRGTVEDMLLRPGLPRDAFKALRARLDASRASVAKLTAIKAGRSPDGRVRGTFQYYGARTGRWAGRRVQPQNLFKGSIKNIPLAISMIAAGAGTEDLEAIFEDSALGVVASCLRSAIIAPPGHLLAIADFSQIEARVLAWLADQRDILRVFQDGKQDVYVHTAAKIGSKNRQLGKVMVLACGYGMGWEKFQKTALTYNLELTDREAQFTVEAWRESNPAIVAYWWKTHDALMDVAAMNRNAERQCGCVTFIRRRGRVLARLPSGRHLVYRHPRVERDEKGRREFSYMAALGKNWTRLRAWPGRTVENLTSAIARDVMAESMLQMGDVALTATVHDELVAEALAAEAGTVLDRMLMTMRTAPHWAPGLPIDANGFITERYRKG